jgi:hypothetical protein
VGLSYIFGHTIFEEYSRDYSIVVNVSVCLIDALLPLSDGVISFEDQNTS